MRSSNFLLLLLSAGVHAARIDAAAYTPESIRNCWFIYTDSGLSLPPFPANLADVPKLFEETLIKYIDGMSYWKDERYVMFLKHLPHGMIWEGAFLQKKANPTSKDEQLNTSKDLKRFSEYLYKTFKEHHANEITLALEAATVGQNITEATVDIEIMPSSLDEAMNLVFLGLIAVGDQFTNAISRADLLLSNSPEPEIKTLYLMFFNMQFIDERSVVCKFLSLISDLRDKICSCKTDSEDCLSTISESCETDADAKEVGVVQVVSQVDRGDFDVIKRIRKEEMEELIEQLFLHLARNKVQKAHELLYQAILESQPKIEGVEIDMGRYVTGGVQLRAFISELFKRGWEERQQLLTLLSNAGNNSKFWASEKLSKLRNWSLIMGPTQRTLFTSTGDSQADSCASSRAGSLTSNPEASTVNCASSIDSHMKDVSEPLTSEDLGTSSAGTGGSGRRRVTLRTVLGRLMGRKRPPRRPTAQSPFDGTPSII